MSREVFLIVGLGNPGDEYANTRHNAGFDSIEKIANFYGIRVWKKMLKGMLAEVIMPDKKVVLVRPQTYMNLSGECVQEVMKWYHCPMDHVVVIYDDIDLPLGRLRVRKSGSAGTHNGMRSIVKCINGQDFPRIRVGVGAKPNGWDLADWVLSRYQTDEERSIMNMAFQKAAAAADDWVEKGIEHCMQEFNRA